MNDWLDFIKGIIRPFIIVWGFIVYGVCIIKVIEVPDILTGLVMAVTIEYFSERAILRLKGQVKQ